MALAKKKRYSKLDLNTIFLNGLGNHVSYHSDASTRPMLVDLAPMKLRLRVYIWNCTNPPGGRALDEYKFQIIMPGQQPRERGRLDYSDGRTPIIGALMHDGDDDVFAFWDAYKHEDFGYSSNMQVKADAIISALCEKVSETVRNNNEKIVCSRPEYVYEALLRRFEIQHEELMEEIT